MSGIEEYMKNMGLGGISRIDSEGLVVSSKW